MPPPYFSTVLCSGGFCRAVKFPNKLQASNPPASLTNHGIVAIVMCSVGEDQHQRVRNGRHDQGISHKSPTTFSPLSILRNPLNKRLSPDSDIEVFLYVKNKETRRECPCFGLTLAQARQQQVWNLAGKKELLVLSIKFFNHINVYLGKVREPVPDIAG